MEELINQLDPFITNTIKLDVLEEMFRNEILEYKLTLYNRPNFVLKNLVNNLSTKQKMMLIFALTENDRNNYGYITADQFTKAFSTSEIIYDKIEILEIFELLAEKFSSEDKQKILSLSYFTKKIFSQFENLEIVKMSIILGKVKTGLIFKKIDIQRIFCEFNPETRTYSKIPLQTISKQYFINRLIEINILDITNSEIEKLAMFLSIKDPKSKIAYISLNIVQHYLRKLQGKYQFQDVSYHKNILLMVNELLLKESKLRKCFDSFDKKNFTVASLRYVLGEVEIHNDSIDEILMRFIEGEEVNFEGFIAKLKNFVESQSSLDEKRATALPLNLTETKVLDASKQELQSTGEKRMNLGELFKQKSQIMQTTGEFNKEKIGRKKHIELVVNTIRSEGREKIENLSAICERFDSNRTGKIKLPIFGTILRFNLKGLTEDQVIVNTFIFSFNMNL